MSSTPDLPMKDKLYPNENQRQSLYGMEQSQPMYGQPLNANQPLYGSGMPTTNHYSTRSIGEIIGLAFLSLFTAFGFITYAAGAGLVTFVLKENIDKERNFPLINFQPFVAELWYHVVFFFVTFCIALYMACYRTQGDPKYLASILLAIAFVFANSDASRTFSSLNISSIRSSFALGQLERAFRVTFAGSLITSIALLGLLILLSVTKKVEAPARMSMMNSMGK